MTVAGWIFMIVSWAVIIGLFTFCMTRTLRPGKTKDGSQNPDSPAQE
jgi:hypothetical protein